MVRRRLRKLSASRVRVVTCWSSPSSLPAGRQPSRPRRLLNLASAVGTDITRSLDDLVHAQPVEMLGEYRSLLGGYYQATLFRRMGFG